MNPDNTYLLLETRQPRETMDGNVPFSLCHIDGNCKNWVTMSSEYEISVHAPRGFCVYFSAEFTSNRVGCALWVNGYEVKATRCRGVLYGSAIVIPTGDDAQCSLSLRLTNKQCATVTAAKLFLFQL